MSNLLVIILVICVIVAIVKERKRDQQDKRKRDESGNGCLGLVLLAIVVLAVFVACKVVTSDATDCYSTPGSQSGSAQHERDVARCLDL